MKRFKNTDFLIKSERVIIRPYYKNDYKSLQISHHERLKTRSKFDLPIPIASCSKPEFLNKIDRQRSNLVNGSHFVLGVFESSTKKYIGQLDYWVINHELSWINLGFHFQNQFWGKGLAKEACKLSLTHILYKSNFHRVEAATLVNNKKARKLCLASGLQYEGVRKNFFAGENGLNYAVYGTNGSDYKPNNRRIL